MPEDWHSRRDAGIDAVLAKVIAAAPTPPAWATAWASLLAGSSEAQRLAVYQTVRDSATVPEEAGFFLVSLQIDDMSAGEVSPALADLEAKAAAIERAHGLGEHDFWRRGEGPLEYDAIQQQIDDVSDAQFAAKLEELGEVEMARLFRTDRDRFEQLQEQGREFFFGPESVEDEEQRAEEWRDYLLEAVSLCMEVSGPMGPLGMCYRVEEDFWEVEVFPTPVELIGGAHDGAVVAPGFYLNLDQLRSAFDSVAEFGWDALGLDDPLGPHISIEGRFQGRQVLLQVFAQAPEDEEPGLKFDAAPKPRPPE